MVEIHDPKLRTFLVSWKNHMEIAEFELAKLDTLLQIKMNVRFFDTHPSLLCTAHLQRNTDLLNG